MDTSKRRRDQNHHRRRQSEGRNRYRCCPIRIHGFGNAERRCPLSAGHQYLVSALKQIDAAS